MSALSRRTDVYLTYGIRIRQWPLIVGILAALVVLFGTGCFEVEQSIELKRDLSGTANFKLGIDMEPWRKTKA
jgi:uncharacterized integral membrane protein